MLDAELLEILVCPETRQALRHADDSVLSTLNAEVERGTLRNRGGDTVSQPLEDGLVREDGQVLYPVRDGIPIMLLDEAIEVTSGS